MQALIFQFIDPVQVSRLQTANVCTGISYIAQPPIFIAPQRFAVHSALESRVVKYLGKLSVELGKFGRTTDQQFRRTLGVFAIEAGSGWFFGYQSPWRRNGHEGKEAEGSKIGTAHRMPLEVDVYLD
jgi:hypothetical protein